MRFPLLLVVLLVGGILSPAAGQEAGVPQPAPSPAWEAGAASLGTTDRAAFRAELPAEVFVVERASGAGESRWSRTHYTVGGILGGAVVGAAVFLLQSNGCWRRAESMCELAIPLYVGAGAAAGGVIGNVLGARSR